MKPHGNDLHVKVIIRVKGRRYRSFGVFGIAGIASEFSIYNRHPERSQGFIIIEDQGLLPRNIVHSFGGRHILSCIVCGDDIHQYPPRAAKSAADRELNAALGFAGFNLRFGKVEKPAKIIPPG